VQIGSKTIDFKGANRKKKPPEKKYGTKYLRKMSMDFKNYQFSTWLLFSST
jgi:hypothetical protein